MEKGLGAVETAATARHGGSRVEKGGKGEDDDEGSSEW